MATVTHQSTWDARIARARELASSRPAARDLLTFYAALAEYQRALAASARDGVTFDVDRVVEAIPDFLTWLRRTGPPDLAASVDIDCVASALRASHTDRVASGFEPVNRSQRASASAGRIREAESARQCSLPP